MQLSLDGLLTPEDGRPREKNGAVYTRSWVVDLILDLAGYVETEDLVPQVAVEPATGEGAFLVPMVRRLMRSSQHFSRPIGEATTSLAAFELDGASAQAARAAVVAELRDGGVGLEEAERLARGWVRTDDYLLSWHRSPPADFVLGNPPYIRLEDVPDAIASLYRKQYRTMVGRADMYVAFFEAALKHLKDGGVCGFICADRWMLNHYGTELRRFVSSGFSVEAVIEMHRSDAFHTSVSAYPAVTIIRRGPQGPAIVAKADARAGTDGAVDLATSLRRAAASGTNGRTVTGFRATRVESWFSGGDTWPCVSPERLALLKSLEARFAPLEDSRTRSRVGIGVATGADNVFITRDATLVEASLLVPLAMAPDTRTGSLQWSGHYLVDPWAPAGRLVDLDAYPLLREYLDRHRSALMSRHIANRRPQSWYRTIDRVHHALICQRKIYLPDIKGTIHPVLSVVCQSRSTGEMVNA